MILTTIMFGLQIGEFLGLVGLILALFGGMLYIRTKLVEIEIKMVEVITDLKTLEVKVEINNNDIWAEKDKMDIKLDKTMDKFNDKLDHLVDLMGDMKIVCAKMCRSDVITNYTYVDVPLVIKVIKVIKVKEELWGDPYKKSL